MVPTLFAFLALQSSALVRDLHANLERKYRVKVEQEEGDHYSYRLQLKIAAPKAAPANALKIPGSDGQTIRLQLKLNDYRATMSGSEVKLATMGGGEMPIGESELPQGIDLAGLQGPIWLPLISLYLPTISEDGDFSIVRSDVGHGLMLSGKGSLQRKKGTASVTLDAAIGRGEKELGKLKVTTTFDPQGWPRKSEGSLVSADGTYRFTLDRA